MAFCSECGTDIGTAKFCSNCGASNAPKNVENKASESPKERQKEKELAQFTDGFNCDIRLTTEKIYAKSIGIEETYALRSVDGIGVYDDLEKFKKDKLEAERIAKSKQTFGVILYVLAALLLMNPLTKVLFWDFDSPKEVLVFSIFGGFIIFFGYLMMKSAKQFRNNVPLDSYVKIIISGHNKLYLFNKKADDAADVAEFINKVEDTLTKYV